MVCCYLPCAGASVCVPWLCMDLCSWSSVFFFLSRLPFMSADTAESSGFIWHVDTLISKRFGPLACLLSQLLFAIREASEASYLSISHILPGSNTVLEFLEFGGFAAWLLTSAHNQLRLFGACQIFDKWWSRFWPLLAGPDFRFCSKLISTMYQKLPSLKCLFFLFPSSSLCNMIGKNFHKKGIIIVISLFFSRTFLQKKHSEFLFQHIFSPIYSDWQWKYMGLVFLYRKDSGNPVIRRTSRIYRHSLLKRF